MTKNEMIKELAARDSISTEQAKMILDAAIDRLLPLFENEHSVGIYDTAIDLWVCETGLPPEYMFDALL